MTDEWLYFGILLKKQHYSEANKWVEERVPKDEDDKAFIDIQKLNLKFLSQGKQAISLNDSLRLEAYAGNKDLLSAPYAVGLLKIVFDRVFEIQRYEGTIIDEESFASSQSDGAYFMLYPNPASDKIRLYGTFSVDSKLTMYDSYGKFIRTIDGAGKDTRNLDINISDLPSGIYYIVMNAGAKSERYKFVKI